MKPFLVYLTLLFACQVALFLQGAQADSEHGIPNPIADYGQFVKFPNVSITRWEAEEINIENVLNVLEDTLTQTGGVFQTMAKYTCSSATSFRNEDSTTSAAFDIQFQERKDSAQSRLFFKPRSPTLEKSPKVDSLLRKTWSEKILKKFTLTRQAEAGTENVEDKKRNFYPLPDQPHVRPRNFWRVNKLEDEADFMMYPYSAIVRVASIDQDGNPVFCTGSVVGDSTVLTAPQCVWKAKYPPLVFTGFQGNGMWEHAFVADQVWIPSNYDPCTFNTTRLTRSTAPIPVPSLGSFTLMHIARKNLKKDFFIEIGDVTGQLGLGAVYLPDLATLLGHDSGRDGGDSLNILEADVRTIFNKNGHAIPGTKKNVSFYNDYFNVEGNWAARGAPAIVNLGIPHPEDLIARSSNPLYWYKLRNIVAGVVSLFQSDIQTSFPSSQRLRSSSGSMFGVDFVGFLYEYCAGVCESSCDIDHACGNGRIDQPHALGGAFGAPPVAPHMNLDYYPPWYLPEQCDNGWKRNSERPNSACRSDCTLAKCGDFIIDTAPEDGRASEQCEPPNTDTCDDQCHFIVKEALARNDNYVIQMNNPGFDMFVHLNDSFGDPTSVRATSDPSNGVVTGTGSPLRYVPNNNFAGTDTFQYKICGTLDVNQCSVATVSIWVQLKVEGLAQTFTQGGNLPAINLVVINPSSVNASSLRIVTAPKNGTAQINASPVGTVRYDPVPADGVNPDFFIYEMCAKNFPTNCAQNRVNITITVPAVSAANDFATTNMNVPVTINVINNDNTLSRPYSLTIDAGKLPANAASTPTKTADSTGFIYTPKDRFAGQDSFGYVLCAITPPDNCATATVFINVNIQGNNDFFIVTQGTTNNVLDVVANDSISVSTRTVGATSSKGGSTAFAGNTISYAPRGSTPNSFAGTDTFTYTICASSPAGNCFSPTVTVLVLITAINQTYAVAQGASNVQLNVTRNNRGGYDFSKVTITPDIDGIGSHVTYSSTGIALYTPPSTFSGTDHFLYTICSFEPQGNCATATATVKVGIGAIDDFYTFQQASGLHSLNILANDGGNPRTVTLGTPTSGATAVFNTVTGNADYTAPNSFAGTDTFIYTVCADSENCATAVVTVTINIIAVPDTYNVTMNLGARTLTVLANDPGSGDPNTLSIFGTRTVPSVIQRIGNSFSYTSPAGFAGVDSWQYQICTDSLLSNCAQALVTVNVLITAVDDAFTVSLNSANNALDVLLNDGGGADLTRFRIITPPAHGSAQFVSGKVNYTPTAKYAGSDSFVYETCASAPVWNCATATVSLTVTIIAVNDNYEFDQATGAHTLNVVSNDDAQFATFTLGTIPASVSVTHLGSGLLNFTAPDSFAGSVVFTYTICSTGGVTCANAQVTVKIKIKVRDDQFTVTQATSNNPMNVLSNDYGSYDASTLIISSNPVVTGSIATVSSGNTFYTPRSSPPFAGLDTFQYNVCTDSSRTNCATGTVVVTVQIDANDDFFDVRMNSANNELNVLSNEPGGGDLTKFTISIPPTRGTASISNNVILYTPTTSFTGRDTFQYKICASAPANNCDFATVTIRVNITATDDVFNFNQNTGLHQLGVTANDGSTFAEFRLGTPSVAVATINYQGGGVVAFQVPSNWAGTVTFTYTICAEAGCVENTATATVTVNIQIIVIDDHFTVTP